MKGNLMFKIFNYGSVNSKKAKFNKGQTDHPQTFFETVIEHFKMCQIKNVQVLALYL